MYDCHLSTRKVEGINNKIEVMKRNAYGFRTKSTSNLGYMHFMTAPSLKMSDEPDIHDP